MRIVLDTNSLLAALPKASRYRSIISALTTGRIELVVSTAILLEYQEILTRKTNEIVANNFLEFMAKLPNVVRVDTPFMWGIIEADPDDNKFVDAGLIAGADCVVTFDNHFTILKSHPFPAMDVLNPDQLLTKLEELTSGNENRP
ncbi:putative PIN family toxin of toxin-antitoxin system [Spirosoma oryzae]|uniref:Putative PIN family toxin of toxin-antitoxin system n=1 Tax=Spirosoma oryzae TaxID=1469603 RepID=A0A2T0T8I1_9BACT|nr:putative toxin-antitoxin system toxin component, PIN family [Spirosoma oryzae]PRY41967.1 putative PIN family toxin of toxin-antitoxin system [Spirosoma oryzae]